jgi:hypothetical protein
MTTKFRIGDHVRWNSEAGFVSGTIIKVHTRDTDYKGYTHHASVDDPQFEIRSDKSNHVANAQRCGSSENCLTRVRVGALNTPHTDLDDRSLDALD